MSIELLRQIAATPLPASFTAAKDVDAVRILRQAGLVIAVPEEPPEGAVKVVAITEKGNEELLRLHYPQYRAPDPVPKSSWLQLAGQRARAALRETRWAGRRRF